MLQSHASKTKILEGFVGTMLHVTLPTLVLGLIELIILVEKRVSLESKKTLALLWSTMDGHRFQHIMLELSRRTVQNTWKN